MTINILHLASHFLVLDKPAGLNVERLFTYASVEGWVEEYLRQQGVKKPFVGIVHRLDRPVSGALVVATRKSALKDLNEQFREGKIKKTYYAIVEGIPGKRSGELRHFLRKDQLQKRAIATDRPLPGAVECRLRYKMAAQQDQLALLEVHPLSGKFHQIRAQLAATGHPIVGDEKYGAKTIYSPDGIALHARELHFTNPQTGEAVKVVAPWPEVAIWNGLLGRDGNTDLT